MTKPEQQAYAVYLGDGAYATRRYGEIILTTGSHDEQDADNRVVLGETEWKKLVRFVENPSSVGDPVAAAARRACCGKERDSIYCSDCGRKLREDLTIADARLVLRQQSSGT